MALIRHKITLVETSVPDAEAALPYFPDHEIVPEPSAEATTSGEDSTAKTTTQRSKS